MIVLENIIVKEPGLSAGFFYACWVRQIGLRSPPFYGVKRSHNLIHGINNIVFDWYCSSVAEYLIVDEKVRGSIPCYTAGSGRGKTGPS